MSQSVTIAVASKNPVKVGAIEAAYRKHFPDHICEMKACSVASGVPDQPMSDAETLRGALNRLEALRQSQPTANLWAAIEGGVDETDQGMVGFAWIVVETETQRGSARSATFPLPEKVAQLVRGGTELGLVNDEVFGRVNSKQKEGAVGILTSGLVDRQGLYEHAALFALVPIQQATLFAS